MNIELKPIAESKVRQLGADVCGVLVRTEDGVMAVSEHGRCTRLDAGVMGPVDRAQGGQGAEAVGSIKSCACQFTAEGGLLKECLYHQTRYKPQPAVPEGFALVPESMCLSYQDIESIITMTGWDEGQDNFGEGVLWVGALKDDDGNETYGLHISCIEVMEEGALPVQEFQKPELSTPTTPKADGWVKCEDRLPTEADDDFNGCVWARFEDGDIALMEGEEVEQTWDDDISITHWMPTGLKRPAPPAEQEGKGGE
ncbi:hypothetical protein [Marinobacter alkaliphilus]|uniref:DUF551 domain-containing protein n=1 Tax=Marinobacter alkaliphilus TaxID=254719 RepID=A0ABZ3E7Q2_9GAMM